MERNKENIFVGNKKASFPSNPNTTSPLTVSKLAAKINMLSSTSVPSRVSPLTAFQNRNTTNSNSYKQIIDAVSALIPAKNILDFYSKLHRILSNYLGCTFTAYGLYNEMSGCINLKLLDKSDNPFVSKVFKSDTQNPVVQSFITQSIISTDNLDFMNRSYSHNCPVTIFPMISCSKCIGVMVVADKLDESSLNLCSFISKFAATVIDNFMLIEFANEHMNTDNLTQLCNHRGFQESLSRELELADENSNDLSLILLDVNNITKINRELGHAKGDEVIKLVADKVKNNIKKTDIAGRYGGDEIAIILPKTNISEAKYIAEYITYSLSCCFVDDVGPVKVSVGVASYPECANDQEKLLVLAEQAMFISQAKGYKDGMSAIISSSDFNFWDDVALQSYAEVLTKRHTKMGMKFEDEILNKFTSENIKSDNHLTEIATSLAGAIDAKDPYTKGHSTSVSRYSEALARAINLPENDVKKIALGALLHDVGKIGIPEDILKKPSKLSDDEWAIMKQHPVIGVDKVLKSNESLKELIPIVKYHHEHVDGTGYPEKLKGDEIPLSAKIVAVADAFHALISDRPYRKGLSLDVACKILTDGAGKQWDNDLIRKFIQIAPSLSTKI